MLKVDTNSNFKKSIRYIKMPKFNCTYTFELKCLGFYILYGEIAQSVRASDHEIA